MEDRMGDSLGDVRIHYARRYDHYDLYPRFRRSDKEQNALLG